MIASVAAIGWVSGVCLAEAEKPTIEQILRVWKSRQEKVSTARFELNCEETIHKGSTSFLESDRRRMAKLPPEQEPNPPRDYQVTGTSSINLDGSKLRYTYDHQQWDPIGKKLYPEHYVDVFDGHLFKYLQIPVSGQKDYPSAAVRKVLASQSALKYPIIPLIFTLRGSHPQFFHKLEKFQVGGKIIVAERPCWELVPIVASSKKQEVLYLDQERDYVVVREMLLIDNQPNWQVDATYSPDAAAGWVPRSWEYVIRSGKEHRILHSGRSKVTSYEINPSMDDKEFDISFPPKTRVHDESSGEYVEYVVKENGEQGREIPAQFNPTYEDLQKPGTRINRWMMISVWAGIFLLTFGGWLWWRRRRARLNH